MPSAMTENLREIVNGSQLSTYVGKKVSLTGTFLTRSSNGLSFELKSVDNVTVKVTLRKPLTEHLEGCIEVHGTAQSGNSILCDEYFLWMADGVQFLAEDHNILCGLINSYPRLWETENMSY